jgi:EAL domain-containing protein (putative c-di-GMP-specific phosphodiesterase class I)
MPPACALFILALNDEVLRPGLINEIGIWTLERACRDWNTLKKYTHFAQPFFNVNLSLSQLNSESLVSEVQGILKS